MAEHYRFFDSTGEDERVYTADEFAEYFRCVLSDGIFNGGTNLKVETKGTDIRTYIQPGYAWLQGYMYKIDVEPLYMQHDYPDPSQDRIDRVVIRLDKRLEHRYVKAFILQGTPAANPIAPALTRNENIFELSLAQVLIKAGKSYIEGWQVTDERLDNNVCGLVDSLIQADTTEIFNQFQAWYNSKTAEFQQEWDDWFNQMKAGAIPDGTITDAKIGNRTINQATAPTNNTAQLTAHLSGLAHQIKALSGKSDWKTAPAKTIEQLSADKAEKTAVVPKSQIASGTYDFNGQTGGSWYHEIKNNNNFAIQNGPHDFTAGTVTQGEGSHSRWLQQQAIDQNGGVWYRWSRDASGSPSWRAWRAGTGTRLRRYVTARDTEGSPTEIQYKSLGGILYAKAVFTNPNYAGEYQTLTITYYKADGTTIVETETFALGYFDDGNFESFV